MAPARGGMPAIQGGDQGRAMQAYAEKEEGCKVFLPVHLLLLVSFKRWNQWRIHRGNEELNQDEKWYCAGKNLYNFLFLRKEHILHSTSLKCYP